jgi:hypothetical protein
LHETIAFHRSSAIELSTAIHASRAPQDSDREIGATIESASFDFSLSPTLIPLHIGDGAAGESLGLAGGLCAGGVGFLAALVLLLLLFKRKKKTPDEPLPAIEIDETTTITEPTIFISEYGFSDDFILSEVDDQGVDLPRECLSAGQYNSDRFASQENPDDFEFLSDFQE